jgi:hypothetical protein
VPSCPESISLSSPGSGISFDPRALWPSLSSRTIVHHHPVALSYGDDPLHLIPRTIDCVLHPRSGYDPIHSPRVLS